MLAQVKISTYMGDRIILPQNLTGQTIYAFIKAGFEEDKLVRRILWNDKVVRFHLVAGGKDFLCENL